MTQIRLDKVQLTSLLEAYINYDTLVSNISISGSVANGATADFSTSIAYSETKTRADLYARNTTTNTKRPIIGGIRQSPYVPVSTETCSITATYSAGAISVNMAVFNGTGGLINLTPQTIEISAVLYKVPISA